MKIEYYKRTPIIENDRIRYFKIENKKSYFWISTERKWAFWGSRNDLFLTGLHLVSISKAEMFIDML